MNLLELTEKINKKNEKELNRAGVAGAFKGDEEQSNKLAFENIAC